MAEVIAGCALALVDGREGLLVEGHCFVEVVPRVLLYIDKLWGLAKLPPMLCARLSLQHQRTMFCQQLRGVFSLAFLA